MKFFAMLTIPESTPITLRLQKAELSTTKSGKKFLTVTLENDEGAIDIPTYVGTTNGELQMLGRNFICPILAQLGVREVSDIKEFVKLLNNKAGTELRVMAVTPVDEDTGERSSFTNYIWNTSKM